MICWSPLLTPRSRAWIAPCDAQVAVTSAPELNVSVTLNPVAWAVLGALAYVAVGLWTFAWLRQRRGAEPPSYYYWFKRRDFWLIVATSWQLPRGSSSSRTLLTRLKLV